MHPFDSHVTATDTASELDRIFFDCHPRREVYARPALDGEFGNIVHDDDDQFLVIVVQLGPGLRLRAPHVVRRNKVKRFLRLSETELRRRIFGSRPFASDLGALTGAAR